MSERAAEPLSEWRADLPLVRGKSVYEKPDASDGLRVLTTQYWPRGIAKAAVDEYVRALGPSRDLLGAFKRGDISWEEYRSRYLDEMAGEAQRSEIHRLAKLGRSQPVTIMCMCSNEEQCHRSLLRDLIERFNE